MRVGRRMVIGNEEGKIKRIGQEEDRMKGGKSKVGREGGR